MANLHWTERDRALRNLARALIADGWTVHKYQPQKREQWHTTNEAWYVHVAEKSGHVLVVDETGNSLEGWNLDNMPEFRPNRPGTLWHIERDGRIIRSGSQLSFRKLLKGDTGHLIPHWNAIIGSSPWPGRSDESATGEDSDDEEVTGLIPAGVTKAVAGGPVDGVDGPVTWAIWINARGNIEVAFSGRPTPEVRLSTVKSYSLRWHSATSVWWTKAEYRYDGLLASLRRATESHKAAHPTATPVASIEKPAESDVAKKLPKRIAVTVGEYKDGKFEYHTEYQEVKPEAKPKADPELWQMTQAEYQESKAKTVAGGVPIMNVRDGRDHKKAVRDAIKQGLDIPDRVLADYRVPIGYITFTEGETKLFGVGAWRFSRWHDAQAFANFISSLRDATGGYTKTWVDFMFGEDLDFNKVGYDIAYPGKQGYLPRLDEHLHRTFAAYGLYKVYPEQWGGLGAENGEDALERWKALVLNQHGQDYVDQMRLRYRLCDLDLNAYGIHFRSVRVGDYNFIHESGSDQWYHANDAATYQYELYRGEGGWSLSLTGRPLESDNTGKFLLARRQETGWNHGEPENRDVPFATMHQIALELDFAKNNRGHPLSVAAERVQTEIVGTGPGAKVLRTSHTRSKGEVLTVTDQQTGQLLIQGKKEEVVQFGLW